MSDMEDDSNSSVGYDMERLEELLGTPVDLVAVECVDVLRDYLDNLRPEMY